MATTTKAGTPTAGFDAGKFVKNVGNSATALSLILTVDSNRRVREQVSHDLANLYLLGDFTAIAVSAAVGGVPGLAIGLGFGALGGSQGIHNKFNATREIGRNATNAIQRDPQGVTRRLFFPEVPSFNLGGN